MLLLFTAFFLPLYAQCPLKKDIPQKIKTIETIEISALIEKGYGCITLVELWASTHGGVQRAFRQSTYAELSLLTVSLHTVDRKRPHAARLLQSSVSAALRPV